VSDTPALPLVVRFGLLLAAYGGRAPRRAFRPLVAHLRDAAELRTSPKPGVGVIADAMHAGLRSLRREGVAEVSEDVAAGDLVDLLDWLSDQCERYIERVERSEETN
jgi:hypothetical protein